MNDTWDYQWMLTCWKQSGLSATPSRSQTHNIGFGADATHTTEGIPDHVKEAYPEPLEFPLVHPVVLERKYEMEKPIEVEVWNLNHATAIKREIRSVPWLGDQLESVRKYFVNKKAAAKPVTPGL